MFHSMSVDVNQFFTSSSCILGLELSSAGLTVVTCIHSSAYILVFIFQYLPPFKHPTVLYFTFLLDWFLLIYVSYGYARNYIGIASPMEFFQ